MTKYEMFKLHRDLTQVIEEGVSKGAEQKLNAMLGEVLQTISWAAEREIKNHMVAVAEWISWVDSGRIVKSFENMVREAKRNIESGESIYPFDIMRKLDQNENPNGNPNKPREVD